MWLLGCRLDQMWGRRGNEHTVQMVLRGTAAPRVPLAGATLWRSRVGVLYSEYGVALRTRVSGQIKLVQHHIPYVLSQTIHPPILGGTVRLQ